jgi:hypothetical protein
MESESEVYTDSIKLCMACGSDDDLINDMYCEDCDKRQRFMHIFDESSCYKLGAYFGKHILEKHLGYYVSETEFIAFMLVRGYKFDEKKRCFRVKINKKRAYNILGFYI